MKNFSFYLALLLIWPSMADAATVSLAYSDRTGKPLFGLTIEGDIESGDTDKLQKELLDYYFIYGPAFYNIYLMSRGGDVDEAIKMGQLIRELRLETVAPAHFKNLPLMCPVKLKDKNNCRCSSACFLAYAGGVDRQGGMLVLHRPYVFHEAAQYVSDAKHEALQKSVMKEVREYLEGMEVDSFFIDKAMNHSSQDAYIVSELEATEHYLSDTVPSIKEIILTRCEEITSAEERAFDTNSVSPEEKKEILAKLFSYDECKDKVLEELRERAFDRKIDDLFVRPKCNILTSTEEDTLIATRDDESAEAQKIRRPLIRKSALSHQCRSNALLAARESAWKRKKEVVSSVLSKPSE